MPIGSPFRNDDFIGPVAFCADNIERCRGTAGYKVRLELCFATYCSGLFRYEMNEPVGLHLA
jgi:hypothetical protein